MKRRTFCLSLGILWIAAIRCITSVVSFCGSAHAGLAKIVYSADMDNAPAFFRGEITYNTEFKPTVVFRKGEKIGQYTAAHDFYGYSKDGMADVKLDYKKSTWTKDDIIPYELTTGIQADLWTDFDINGPGSKYLALLAQFMNENEADMIFFRRF